MDNKALVKTAESAAVWPFGVPLETVRSELVRKSIHFMIALVPALASYSRAFAIAFLASGVVAYVSMERARVEGVRVPFVSRLTDLASRPRDRGRFVLGPVTLGLGAMLALLLYPAPAAAAAIDALAFGDGFASLIGKLFGRARPAFLLGKSLEGSAACFLAVLYAAWRVTGSARAAIIAAVVATLVEALPLEDFDNIALPVAVGLAVKLTFA